MFPLPDLTHAANPDALAVYKVISKAVASDFLAFISSGGAVSDDPVTPAISQVFANYGWSLTYDYGVLHAKFDLTVVPRVRQRVTDDLKPIKRKLKVLTSDVIAKLRKDYFKQTLPQDIPGSGPSFYTPPNIKLGTVLMSYFAPHSTFYVDGNDLVVS